MKVVLYRGFKDTNLFNHPVGEYEGEIVNLLENSEYNIRYMHAPMLKTLSDASFDLMDKKGILLPAKMKIALSRISGSIDNIKEFMDKVDADVRRLPSNDALPSAISTLGKVLQLTKNIMDRLSQVRHQWLLYIDPHSKSADREQVHPILNASWTIVSSLYQVNCPTKCQAN
jgi:hypothetical protein